jgi:DNA end-binding protein Ku
MAARAIWKGIIQFERTSVPVKLFSAVQDKTIHFRLLHDKDKMPVKQEMVNPQTNQVVASDEIKRGFETEEGDIIILNNDELQSLKPESSRNIKVLEFLPNHAIDHRWYNRSYYLGPDGNNEAYFALIAALEKANSEIVVHWVMRNNEYYGALELQQHYPVLIALRYADEVVSLAELGLVESRDVNDKELAMAQQLVSMLEDKFDPNQYQDEYRNRVFDLIEKKSQGRVVKFEKVEQKKPEQDLSNALKASLQKAKERKSA